MLTFLELNLGCSTGLDDCHAAGELCQALLELLAVVIGIGGLDFLTQLADACLDVILCAQSINDGGFILGDDDLACTAEILKGGVLKREANGLGDHFTGGEDCNVLQHGLAAIAKAGSLDGDRLEGATDVVDNQGCQGFALNVLGNDEQRLAGLHNLFQDRQQFLGVSDLGVDQQDVGILEDSFLAICVVNEVCREVAALETHTFGGLKGGVERVGLFNGHNTFGTNLLEGLSNELANLGIVCGD